MGEILDRLYQDRIFSVEVTVDKARLVFQESCDYYFETALTKAEVYRLAKELTEIADQMEECGDNKRYYTCKNCANRVSVLHHGLCEECIGQTI